MNFKKLNVNLKNDLKNKIDVTSNTLFEAFLLSPAFSHHYKRIFTK